MLPFHEASRYGKGLLDVEKQVQVAKKRAMKAKRASVYADIVQASLEEEDADKLEPEEEAKAAAEQAEAEDAAVELAEAMAAEKRLEVEKADRVRKSLARQSFAGEELAPRRSVAARPAAGGGARGQELGDDPFASSDSDST